MIQNPRLKSQIRNLGRHFLHAEKLAFTHLRQRSAWSFTRHCRPNSPVC